MTKNASAETTAYTPDARVEITRGHKKGQTGTVYSVIGDVYILEMDGGWTHRAKAPSLRAV